MISGPTFGVGRIRWGWFIVAVVVALLLPAVTDTNTPTLLLIWALFALSLGLMWGFAGILSFGHAAYFGLGAYTYAIAAMTVGESTGPLLLAIVVPARGRGRDRRNDVLRPDQRRLPRRDHARHHPDPVQVHERDRGRRVPHRQRRGSAASTASPHSRS